MTLTRQIAHNTLIQIGGKILGVIFGLLTISLITRYLGQKGFGQYTTILAFLQTFGILVDFGLQMTTIRLISDPQENESKILSNIFTLRLVLSLIFLGLAPLIVLVFPYERIVKIGVALTALAFLFSSLISVLIGLFQKHLAMNKVVIAELGGKIFILGVTFLGVWLNKGLLSIMIAIVIGGLIHFLILFYFSQRLVKFSLAFERQVWQKIFKFSWPIALTIALNLIYFKADTVILSLFRPQTEVGLYGAPYKVLEMLIGFSYLFLGLLLPWMTNAYASQNLDKLKNILQQGFNFMIIIITPMIFGTLFLGREIMTFIAGKDFIISGDILKILILATAAIFLAALFGYAIVAMNQQKKMIKFYAANAIISLVGYLIFIPKYSYWGAAWLTVFTEIFILVSALYIVYKTIKFLPRQKILFQSLGASLVMCLSLYFLSSWNFIFLIFLGAGVYFITLYLLGGFSKQMVLEIVKIRNKQ